MFQTLLIAVSYGALLLLLMPMARIGLLYAAAMFALGFGLMLYKKVLKVAFWKHMSYTLAGYAVFLATLAALGFYGRWLSSYRMNVIATMLHIPLETFLLIVAFALALLSTYFIYVLLHMINRKLSGIIRPINFFGCLIIVFLMSVITVILSQVMIEVGILSMGISNFAKGVLIVSAVILLLYGLFGKLVPAVAFGSGIFMLISTINVYVFSFRERLFEPLDVFSIGTAMNVAENYSLFPLPPILVTCWVIFAAILLVLCCFHHEAKPTLTAKRRFTVLAICAVTSVVSFFCASSISTRHWSKEGAQYYGYILDFASKFKEITVPKPDNYSPDKINELAEQYTATPDEAESEPNALPHIIVIMDEAFSDLTVAGTFSTNTEVTPFISSLKENTISGYALTSVYGGNTANSEYEFLTGNSMAQMSPNSVPYQQYIRSSSYSMVSHLKSSYNYTCVAMHPYLSSGWNRPAVYEYLGFDECYFVEDFPQRDLIRSFVSDQEMFEFLTETYEAKKDDPLFLFGVTMQNHGGYTYANEDRTQQISLTDYVDQFPDVEQYLSLIHETDKAVQHLITYFQDVDEDVVIVFFGDHQPAIDTAFYAAIGEAESNTLDEKQKRYKVPFFIWTNYDIEEEYIDLTSLNYLSSYVYDAAGLPLPPYNQFLRSMEGAIPAINANGFYSQANGCFLTFDEADETEQSWLWSYEALQYNNLFDKKHQNKTMFPTIS